MVAEKREDAPDRSYQEHLDQADFVLPDGTRVRGDRFTAEDKTPLTAAASRNSVDYETDFYAWTVEQTRLLRAGELSAIDAANITEEIESLGRSDRRELQSRLIVLTAHLLKWQKQRNERSKSWSSMIREQRRQIEILLRDSSSLRPFAAHVLTRAYNDAREDAAEETGLPETEFPNECPFPFDDILSRSFLPEP